MTSSPRPYQGLAAPVAPPPLETLYIYYLHGRTRYCEDSFGPEFIGNWEEDDCSFLFFSKPADHGVKQFVKAHPDLALHDTFIMPYEQWQPTDALPLKAGSFEIHPVWSDEFDPTRPDHILLDPGVVFGSGCHATTSACLEALDLICYNNDNNIKTTYDIGTGTGVLAVAAARWGIENVVGLDLNFLAAQTARRNVSLNAVDEQVLILKGNAVNLTNRPVDLFIANIHYDIMSKLLESDGFLGSRFFILSGLLRTPSRTISQLLNKLSIKIIKSWNNDGIWYTFLGKNRLTDKGRSLS